MNERNWCRFRFNLYSLEMTVPGSVTYNNKAPGLSDHREQIFKRLLETLPLAVYTCDKEGYITFYNDHAAAIWGRKPESGKEMWCGSWRIYNVEGEPMSRDACPMAILLKTGKEHEEHEIIIERPDGGRSFVLQHPKLFFNPEGELEGAMNTLEDITSKKNDSEKAAMLGAIVGNSNAAIISKTLNGIVTSWNPAAQQIFGYSAEEMIGEPVIKLIPHDLYHEEEHILAKLRRGEVIEQMQTVRIRKNGELIDVSLTVSPVRDEKGRIIGVSKIARDITAFRKAERLIREADEKFRMAVEATKLGTWEYNPLAQELLWSGETRRIYGLSENDPVDFHVFLRHIHPDDYDYVTRDVEKALDPTGSGSYDITFRIRQKNGAIRWVRTQGKAYFNKQNITERFIGTVLDVTDDKNKNAELEKLVSERTRALKMMNKQLQRSNSDLAQFASVASHDLQEPLRKVQMYCNRILEAKDSKAVFDKFFPRIIDASARMSQLIKDVLHYAQIPDGTDQMEQTDLNEVFDNVTSDLEVSIKERNARVTADFLPSIKGNASQLRQLFTNIISNSIKFSTRVPEVRITSMILRKSEVLSRNRQVHEAPSYVELKFKDNGIGFEQKYAKQVFEIFQRLQDRSVYSGTGIGLAVCKKIVENHHGTISVESEPGEGTTFTVLLPAV